jgi:multidrug transporter EmrE-like cation transporter
MNEDPTRFLRNILRLDALTCAISGTASLALGPMLAGPLGLPLGLLRASGAVLLIVALFIEFAARNTPRLRWPVWAVVIGNTMWVLESVALLLGGSVQPTELGIAYAIAQAVAVAVLAELEFMGLRRSARSMQVA